MKDRSSVRFGGFRGTHAIVVGSSMTGMAATAVAARHFDKVTNIDRDALPDEPVWRKGVPQSRHGHILLRSGQNVLNHYFPGLTTDMLARGSVEVDMANDIAWHHSGGWKKRFDSRFTMQCQTRGFIEHHVRQRLRQIPNISFRDRTEMTGYTTDGDRITGVRLAKDWKSIPADLVIDASGRNSLTPRLLDSIGFGRPETDELKVDIGYSTTQFVPPPDLKRDWKGMLIHSEPPGRRTASLLPTEHGGWIVTLISWGQDEQPSEMEAFLKWTSELPVPDMYHALEAAIPTERVHKWRFPSNLRRRYDRMPNAPDGLVVIGDANTSLNPIYAQGMSHGAVGASLLDASLTAQRTENGPGNLLGLSRRFHTAYGKFLDECWLTSTIEDYGNTPSGRGSHFIYRAGNWYLKKVAELSWTDEDVARDFINVMHMQKAPAELFRASIFLRSLFGHSRGRAPSQMPPRAACFEN